MTIEIRDEELIADLQQIAQLENRPIESVLKSLVKQYPKPKSNEKRQAEIRQIHLNAYAQARAYWHEMGNMERANLTDEQMDEQFGAFDENGIPRMKDELVSDAPEGSLAHALQILNAMDDDDLNADALLDSSVLDDILRDEFGDYIYQRMNRDKHD